MDDWSKMTHWDLVLPPSRPGAWQLDTIRAHTASIDRDCPVAILGSTPEFRDLLFNEGFRDVFVFERDRRFFKAASAMRACQTREHIVWGDWRTTLAKPQPRFAVVLSDLTSGNIQYEDRGAFYSDVASMLEPGGLFVDRLLAHDRPHLELEALGTKYQRLPLNLATVNDFSCEVMFCSTLLSLQNRVDTTVFYDELRSRFAHPTLVRLTALCQVITPPDAVWWYGRPWSQLASVYETSLQIVGAVDEPGASAYAGRARLLVSRRRQPSLREY